MKRVHYTVLAEQIILVVYKIIDFVEKFKS